MSPLLIALLVLLCLATLALLGIYCAARLLIGMALDREGPQVRNMAGMTGIPKDDALGAQLRATRARIEARAARVSIQSHDGLALAGRFVVPEAPKRVILAMHGWRSSWWVDFGLMLDFWHDTGAAILLPDERAHGESAGAHMGFGLLERRDCAAWAAFAAAEFPGLPLYLAGVSMGATTVLMAAELPLPEPVAGILADSGFTSPRAIWAHVAKSRYHVPYRGVFAYFADHVCKQKIGLAPDAASTPAALRHTSLPVLFVHGCADHFIPPAMTAENAAAHPGPHRVLTIPEAHHGCGYAVDPAAYQEALRWLFGEGEAKPD